MMRFELTVSWATTKRFNQLNYTHHKYWLIFIVAHPTYFNQH